MDLIPAVVAYSGVGDWGNQRVVCHDWDIAWGVEEREFGRVQEGSAVHGAFAAVDTAAFATVMSAFPDGESLTAEEGVAVGGLGVGLPEALGE